MRKPRVRGAAAASCSLLVVGLLAACGGSDSGDAASGAQTAAPAAAAAAGPVDTGEVMGIANDLPETLSQSYGGYNATSVASPYADFKAVKGPWKLCYSESWQGNPWRVQLTKNMRQLADQYRDAGLISEFSMSNADNDVARQSQQIRQFADQGCSVIITVAGSPTALNAAIKSAYDKGVPVVTLGSSATSPYVQNVDSNFLRVGAQMAKNATDGADGGAILMVKGLDGISVSEEQTKGAKAQWAKDGGEVEAEVNGDWTASVTKQVVLKALATNPAEIPAVYTTGSEEVQVAEAFRQSGRPLPLITGSISGDALGYWNENKDEFKFNGYGQLPSWSAAVSFRVAMRILDGKQAKINPILVPMPLVTPDDLPELFESCMTPTSSDKYPVLKDDPLPTELMDEYFAEKGEVGPYKYDDIPRPCDGT